MPCIQLKLSLYIYCSKTMHSNIPGLVVEKLHGSGLNLRSTVESANMFRIWLRSEPGSILLILRIEIIVSQL